MCLDKRKWKIHKNWKENQSNTFMSTTASSTGQHSWFLCFLEVWQTTQIGSRSSKQNSFSRSPWYRHNSPGSHSSRVSEVTETPSSIKVSHRFFRVRLATGSSRDSVRQSGQLLAACFWPQYFCKQAEQKLWLHFSTTGSLNMSQQIGQERSSSDSNLLAIITAERPILLWKLGWKQSLAIRRSKQPTNKISPAQPASQPSSQAVHLTLASPTYSLRCVQPTSTTLTVYYKLWTSYRHWFLFPTSI